MNQTYICADMKLFDGTAAEQQNLSIPEYNQMVIDKINSIASENDYLMVYGEITHGTLEETKYYTSQIKAKWKVADLDNQPLYRLQEHWQSIGAEKAYTLDGFIAGSIENDFFSVVILNTNSENTEVFLGNYIALPETIAVRKQLLKPGEIYRDKILNISLSVWDFLPINYKDVPSLINNEILFEENNK